MEINLDTLKQNMTALLKKTDVTANNLANISTNGFKKDHFFVQYLEENDKSSFPETVKTDFRPGTMKETGNPLDLAIGGKGFFSLMDQEGNSSFTRDGHFKIDEEGFLITLNGETVMGKKGTINLKPSEEEKISNINITQVGEVFLNDKFIDQLLIVDFNDYEKINKSGNSQYTNNDIENVIELEDFRIIQGGLEGSNVDPMVEMVQLLETQRNFESTQRAVRSIDDALKKATNEVGKYR